MPLNIISYGGENEIVQFSETERKNFAYSVLEYMASDDTFVGSIVLGTENPIGIFTDSVREGGIGSTDINVLSRTYTLSQANTAISRDGDTDPPKVMGLSISGNNTILQENISSSEEIADYILQIAVTEGPFCYYLGTSAPSDGGVWINKGKLLETFENFISVNSQYSLWKKITTGTSNLYNKPLKLVGQELISCSQQEIKRFSKIVEQRILSTGISTYKLQNSAPGSGVWSNSGTATDLRRLASPVEYIGAGTFYGTIGTAYLGPSPEAYYGVTPAAFYGITPAAFYGTTPAAFYGITPAAFYGTTPAAFYGIAPTTSYGITPTVSYGSTPTVSYGTTPAVFYGTTPAVFYGTTPNTFYGTTPQAFYGSTPTLSYGMASYEGQDPYWPSYPNFIKMAYPYLQWANFTGPAWFYGTTPTTSYGTTPTTSYGVTPTTSYGITPTTSYGSTPTVSYGVSPVTFYGTTPTTFYGATPAVFYGTTPAVFYGTTPAAFSGITPAAFSGITPASFSGITPASFSGITPATFVGTVPAEFVGINPDLLTFYGIVTTETSYIGTLSTNYYGTIPATFSGTQQETYVGSDEQSFYGSTSTTSFGTTTATFTAYQEVSYVGIDTSTYYRGVFFGDKSFFGTPVSSSSEIISAATLWKRIA